jgi:hypothetical protein
LSITARLTAARECACIITHHQAARSRIIIAGHVGRVLRRGKQGRKNMHHHASSRMTTMYDATSQRMTSMIAADKEQTAQRGLRRPDIITHAIIGGARDNAGTMSAENRRASSPAI